MSSPNRDIESLWDSLLSQDPDLIKSAYNLLPEGERLAVYDHLKKMAESEGWLPSQRQSARIALQEIGNRNA